MASEEIEVAQDAPEDDSGWRGALSEAYDKATADVPADSGGVAGGDAEARSEVQADAGEPASGDAREGSDGAGKARDEQGRFVKQDTKPAQDKSAPPPAKPVTGQGATIGAAAPVAAPVAPPAFKVPQSWKPALRELATKLPPEFHPIIEESHRRDREVQTALQEASEARKSWQTFQETVRPFEAMIRAEGADPLRAVGSLLQTAAALRTAPPVAKAQLVAQMVRQFGIPIDALDAALAGQPMPQGAQQQQQYSPQNVAQMVEQAIAQREQQQTFTRASSQVQQFQGEFYKDVRHHMAGIMESAAHQGEMLTLDEAYDRACYATPDVRKILQQREASKAAADRQQSAQRAQSASSSVRSSPGGGKSGPAEPEDDSWRSHLEASLARASSR